MFYRAVREMREDINMDWFDSEMLDTDIGECVEIDGEIVPLDVPIEDLTEDLDEGMPASVIKSKQRNAEMSDEDFAERYKDKSDDDLRSMAWRHGYGKGSNYYVNKKKQGLGEQVVNEAFNLDIGTKVAMKSNGKMIYGKVIGKEKVMGKPGVEVKWSSGGKGRFSNDQFAALSMDKKADYVISESVELDEAEYQGKKVKLNSPKRGGSKKYYVYTKNKKGNVIKVSWGDTTGLKTKANNPGAVKSFVARHDCKNKKDKTKAGYWACRTPRYKSLGVKGGQWW